jgi:hypothetical protein
MTTFDLSLREFLEKARAQYREKITSIDPIDAQPDLLKSLDAIRCLTELAYLTLWENLEITLVA